MGRKTPFKDEELFDVIEELTYPEVREFIDQYIVQGDILPYEEIFGSVGINYNPVRYFEDVSFGFTQASLGIDFENQQLYITDASQLDEFGKKLGFMEGDIILQINGEDMPGLEGMQFFLGKQRGKLVAGETFSYQVQRGEETVELSTEVIPISIPQLHILSMQENPNEDQVKLMEDWLEPQN